MPSLPKSKLSFFALARPKNNLRWSNGEGADIYDSPRWRALRRQVLSEDPFCKFCKMENIATENTIADHIVPISMGGNKWDRNNIQGICAHHHNTKSSYEGKCNSVHELKALLASSRGVGVKNFWGF